MLKAYQFILERKSVSIHSIAVPLFTKYPNYSETNKLVHSKAVLQKNYPFRDGRMMIE